MRSGCGSGEFRVEPGEFSNLEMLDLSSNRFTEVPTGIESLVNLRLLDLRDNQIRWLPDWLAKFSKLGIEQAAADNTTRPRLLLAGNPLEHQPDWLRDMSTDLT